MTELHHTPDGVPFLRSPDSAFDNLPDYGFAPNYFIFQGLRMHYVDEGPRDGPVALLMHGMPTWSFLNRKIIAALGSKGYRCIAADHIGFGRSDKVTDESWYSISRHTDAHRALINHLDLQGITLFCQDWGGPISLAQVAEQPQRFSRLVIMNTWLHHDAFDYSPAVRQWNAGWQAGGLFETNVPEPLSLGWFIMVSFGHMTARDLYGIVQKGEHPPLSAEADAVRRGYDAPHAGLGRAGHAGARRFPLSIPIDTPETDTAKAQAHHFEAILQWQGPVHFIWGGGDDVFPESWGRDWAARYPQATFDLLPGAGHFPQETRGEEIAAIFLKHVGA